MDIISLLVVLLIIGMVVYLANALAPIPAWMKTVINALACLFTLLYLLQATGLWSGFHMRLR